MPCSSTLLSLCSSPPLLPLLSLNSIIYTNPRNTLLLLLPRYSCCLCETLWSATRVVIDSFLMLSL